MKKYNTPSPAETQQVVVEAKEIKLVSNGEPVDRVVSFPNCPRSIFLSWSAVMEDPDVLKVFKGQIKPVEKFFSELLTEFATRNSNLEELSDVPEDVRDFLKNEGQLEDLKKKKSKILDEVMETETYKVAKEILEKYAPEQLRNQSVVSVDRVQSSS